MTGLKPILAGSAALLLAAAGAQAQTQQPSQSQTPSQEQQLSEQEVQDFLDDAQESMTEAVNSGDFGKILEWTQNSIADGAVFNAGMELYAGDERKGFTSLTLTKDDMVRLGGISAGILSGLQRGAIEDYSLEIEMTDFTPIGPNAAMVRTEIVERGRLSLTGASSPAMAGKQSGAAAPGQSQQEGSALTPPAGSPSQQGSASAPPSGTQQGSTLGPPAGSLSREGEGLTTQQGLLSQGPSSQQQGFPGQGPGGFEPGARAQALPGQGLQMEGAAQCSHIIQRSEGSQQLQMGLTTCQADARLSMN